MFMLNVDIVHGKYSLVECICGNLPLVMHVTGCSDRSRIDHSSVEWNTRTVAQVFFDSVRGLVEKRGAPESFRPGVEYSEGGEAGDDNG